MGNDFASHRVQQKIAREPQLDFLRALAKSTATEMYYILGIVPQAYRYKTHVFPLVFIHARTSMKAKNRCSIERVLTCAYSSMQDEVGQNCRSHIHIKVEGHVFCKPCNASHSPSRKASVSKKT